MQTIFRKTNNTDYLKILTENGDISFNSGQTDLFGESSADLSREIDAVVGLVKSNLYDMVDKLVNRAKKGDVSAARLLFTVLPKMIKDMEAVDIWQLLREDDAARKK